MYTYITHIAYAINVHPYNMLVYYYINATIMLTHNRSENLQSESVPPFPKPIVHRFPYLSIYRCHLVISRSVIISSAHPPCTQVEWKTVNKSG